MPRPPKRAARPGSLPKPRRVARSRSSAAPLTMQQRQEEAARQAKIRAEAEAVRKLEEEKRKLEEQLRKAEERLQRDDAQGKTRPPASIPSFGQSGDASLDRGAAAAADHIDSGSAPAHRAARR